MKLYKILIFNILLILSLPAHAQHYIKGVVIEETEQGKFQAVPFANVVWLGTTEGAVTDTSGVFKIAHKPEYKQLIVSFLGYQSDTIAVNETNMNEIRVILKTDKKTLAEVIVTGERGSSYIDYLNPIKTLIMTEKELFKAACCNLSESFETNPSVDVSFSDAVTGVKQVQMLGLAGTYTQITTENLVGVRGLASNYGLGFLPGSWIQSIQVTKGIGSVANGYESIAGQINVELHKPFAGDKLFFNAYQNNFGRTEANLNFSQLIGKKWGTTLMLHYNNTWRQMDMNKDSFLDIPMGNQINAINRWHYDNQKGISAQIGIKLLQDNRLGGQSFFNPDIDKGKLTAYGLEIGTKRYEAFGKIGYVFPQKKYKSIGFMASVVNHAQDSYFGLTTYKGKNQTAYANLIYQSIIGTTIHKFRTGFSYLYDNYNEQFNALAYQRTENVAGAFVEYTYSPTEKFNVVAGLRTDYHNLFGVFVTPRLHARYQATSDLAIRASFGRGQRTANIFAENTSVFVSSRQAILTGDNPNTKAYGLNPEVAWNMGVNLTYEFALAGKNGSLSLDYYRTDFQNQVIVDREQSPQEVHFYNLNGKSFSNSIQAELNYEIIKKLNLRLAYRLFDVQTTYNGKQIEAPLIAKNRAFANLAYEIGRWKFDYTINWNGRKRIPATQSNPIEFQKDNYSPNYWVMNMQITHSFSQTLDLYAGIENIADTRQIDLVSSAESPFRRYFDASLVWGPVIGRMFYGGLRFKIQ